MGRDLTFAEFLTSLSSESPVSKPERAMQLMERIERWRRWLDRAKRVAGEDLEENAAYLAFDQGIAPAVYVAGLPPHG